MIHLTSTMHRKRLSPPGQESKFGDELLWKLVGPTYIVAARDDAWHFVGGHVRLNHHLYSIDQSQPYIVN